MIILVLEYLFNCFFYSLSIYFALLLMEKTGKKRPATKLARAGLAVIWAAGATLLQLVVQATSMVYWGGSQ